MLSSAPTAGQPYQDTVHVETPRDRQHDATNARRISRELDQIPANDNGDKEPSVRSVSLHPAPSQVSKESSVHKQTPASEGTDSIRQVAEGETCTAGVILTSSTSKPNVPTSCIAAPADASDNGLGWIAEVAQSVKPIGSSTTPIEGIGAPVVGSSQSAAGSSLRTCSPLLPSAFHPVSGAAFKTIPAATMIGGEGGGGLVAGTPRTLTPVTETPPLTPKHLDWRPSKGGFENRRWGAPPPEKTNDYKKEEEDDQNPDQNPAFVHGQRGAIDIALNNTHTTDFSQTGKAVTNINVEEVINIPHEAAPATSSQDPSTGEFPGLNEVHGEALPRGSRSHVGTGESEECSPSSQDAARITETSPEEETGRRKRGTAPSQPKDGDELPVSGQLKIKLSASPNSEEIRIERVEVSEPVSPSDGEVTSEPAPRVSLRSSVQHR